MMPTAYAIYCIVGGVAVGALCASGVWLFVLDRAKPKRDYRGRFVK